MKHIHKYKRLESKNGWVTYRCVLSDCPHFLPMIEMALGRYCICWICDNQFQLESSNLRQVKPVCKLCAEDRARRREKLIAIGRKS